jgi:hypothetical protein
MSARELWQASRHGGELLASSPSAAALREAIDVDDTTGPRSPCVALLRHTLAGLGALRTRPLLLGLYLPRTPSIGPIPGYDQITQIEGGPQFLDSAARIASAALSIAEHLRSRLPGYPDIPVPDLCAGSPAVIEDGFMSADRFPWPAAARASRHSGLRGGADLDVDMPALAEGVGQMLAALEAQVAWRQFSELSSQLEGEERAALKRIRQDFQERTAQGVVDEGAGGLLMQRSQYARAVLAEVGEQADGRAGEYLAAFRRVDHLINMALAVLSERTAYNTPVGLPDDTQLTWHRDGDGLQVRAVVPSDPLPFLYPGRLLVYNGDPPAGGALYLQGASHTINFELGSQAELDCQGLEDSAGIFDDLVLPGPKRNSDHH